MSLGLIVLLPFIGALLPPVLIRGGRDSCALVTGAVTAFALAALASHAPAVFAGEVIQSRCEWLPGLGLDANFFLDPLGFFFAALILGIGLLIIAYARFYLSKDDPMGRFMSFLLLFQGAMLGIVLSDNVLLLLVFWELTSLTSFLLIGYWRHLPEGRQGARMALVVTGGGGLALIGGMLLLGRIAGSYDLSVILTRGEVITASPLYLPALLLILAGAFTKSAQFPFHFWLPHAMAAPTPVSAYLHSATMVKAGVFLLARVWPAMAGGEAWFLIVAPVGLATMLIAAWIALFKDDLKAILAFSTVSQLGFMTMLFGLGTPLAALAGVFHILNHCAFKAALFMTAGIVDHEAGSRDARRLGGLVHLMPLTATIALIASAAMAGVPLFNGFISKEMMLEAAAATVYGGNPWVFPVAATLAALLSVAYSARLAVHVFLGSARDDYPHQPRDPPTGLWLPPALLLLPVLAIGLLPVLAQDLVTSVAAAVVGAPLPVPHFALWHGFTPAFVMSLLALAGGAALLLLFAPLNRLRQSLPRPDAKRLFDAAIAWGVHAAGGLTAFVQNGALQRYLAVILAVAIGLGFSGFMTGELAPGDRPMLPVTPIAAVGWLIVIGASAGVFRFHHNRLFGIVLTSVVGLMVCVAFLHFSAPDLALTQISVEVVTTILLLSALNYLPRSTPPERQPLRLLRDGVLAGAAGIGVFALLLAVLTRNGQTIAGYYLETSKPMGGGTNVVNVILVDYRGYDTFGEIIVLGIAALAIVALLETALRGEARRRLAGWEQVTQAAEAHPMVLVVASRVLLPFALTVGVYIFLRGHNEPGGGFIAGLVVGIALIIQYMASGFGWAAARLRVDYHGFVGAGVLIAGLTGIGAWLAGEPFLTSSFGYLHLPLLGKLELATAMGFDLGVFLTVLGVVMLALAGLSRIGRIVDPDGAQDEPMDTPLRQTGAGASVAAALPAETV